MSELAWHFCEIREGRPVLRDGRPLVIGEWLEHEGEVEICRAGLHASTRVIDALYYAPGPFVSRVEFDEVVERADDKVVCRRRRPLWGYDASGVLRKFARRCALDVIDLWTPPDVVRCYIETGDESQRSAARDAARAAARDAAWDAAGDAAWDAAWDAARDAAGDAAWDAAGDAARAAARAVAWDAARAAAGDAAGDAARAAWDAAIRAYSSRLVEMLSSDQGERT